MESQSKLRHPVTKTDHIQGREDALITLVEYGDYECPYCGKAYPLLKEIQKNLGEGLCLVFRNFPLAQIHPHALNAAKAAEAAALQGSFWEMHDLLFENQNHQERDNLLSYATGLTLDLDKFITDMDSDEVEERISKDFYEGARTGVNGTPTFFVNGYRFEGDWTSGEFLEELNALKEKSISRKKHDPMFRPRA